MMIRSAFNLTKHRGSVYSQESSPQRVPFYDASAAVCTFLPKMAAKIRMKR